MKHWKYYIVPVIQKNNDNKDNNNNLIPWKSSGVSILTNFSIRQMSPFLSHSLKMMMMIAIITSEIL